MNPVAALFNSTLGRKYLMALSGLALLLFVVGHMVGNLQFLLGPEAINSYAAFLHSKPELLWGARIGLIVMVVVHVSTAIKLSAANKAARPVAYLNTTPKAASYASRTMLMSGLIIAAFLVYHLLHFTLQVPAVNMAGVDFKQLSDTQHRPDVYMMMVKGFSQPLISIFYLVATGLLSLHLSHGVASMFQSLGVKQGAFGRYVDKMGIAVAFVLLAGYWSLPLSVLLGLKK